MESQVISSGHLIEVRDEFGRCEIINSSQIKKAERGGNYTEITVIGEEKPGQLRQVWDPDEYVWNQLLRVTVGRGNNNKEIYEVTFEEGCSFCGQKQCLNLNCLDK